MAILSKNEFMAMQEAKQAQRQDYSQERKNYVSYFSLKDDGDEAIVRIVNDPEEFEVYTVHPVTVNGKFRKVNCINDINEGVHSCPLCEAGVQLQNRFYIKLIEYTRDEAGNIVPEAKIWERPTSYIQRLVNLYTEYGSLKDNVFKIKRNGAKGDMKTDYVFMFANPSIYNEQLYVKDFSAFDDYSPLGTAILNRNIDEMKDILVEMNGGHIGETFTPQVAQPQIASINPQQYNVPPMNVNTQTNQINSQDPVWTSAASGQSDQPRRSPVMY